MACQHRSRSELPASPPSGVPTRVDLAWFATSAYNPHQEICEPLKLNIRTHIVARTRSDWQDGLLQSCRPQKGKCVLAVLPPRAIMSDDQERVLLRNVDKVVWKRHVWPNRSEPSPPLNYPLSFSGGDSSKLLQGVRWHDSVRTGSPGI